MEALELMAKKGLGALVVLENDEVVGIMSERDYARKIILMGRQSQDTPVKDIMTREVYGVHDDTTAEECMALMTDKHIRHLPVCKEGKLAGDHLHRRRRQGRHHRSEGQDREPRELHHGEVSIKERGHVPEVRVPDLRIPSGPSRGGRGRPRRALPPNPPGRLSGRGSRRPGTPKRRPVHDRRDVARTTEGCSRRRRRGRWPRGRGR
ncbi:MAG: CBS domain-containing protein [Ignavibacteriales bacterium]|nr:CBS domain-containing protein [Ignavibacteriales bacterium]